MIIAEALRSTADALRDYSDAPDIDAQQMILHILRKREPSTLLAHATDTLLEEQLRKITFMTEKRMTGMPLAYILREADFYGRTFMVTPDVLIPRPDTETLIEKTLEYIKNNFADNKEITIADIGTGSGCIAITLAKELPEHCRIVATDISEAALAVATQNAHRHGAQNRITFLQGDLVSPLHGIHIDLIVSNPPYVPTDEVDRAGTSRDTRGLTFEPRIALDGGIDGQNFVDQIKRSGIPAIIETIGGTIITTQ
jgi:release factor glutamine methyltransferase